MLPRVVIPPRTQIIINKISPATAQECNLVFLLCREGCQFEKVSPFSPFFSAQSPLLVSSHLSPPLVSLYVLPFSPGLRRAIIPRQEITPYIYFISAAARSTSEVAELGGSRKNVAWDRTGASKRKEIRAFLSPREALIIKGGLMQTVMKSGRR